MKSMLDNDAIINQTKKWLSTVVIKHTLCPFAQREYDKGSIHYEVVETADLESQLEHIRLQCTVLNKDANKETTLLIFPTALSDFDNYLDVLETANALLKDQSYEGIYQLASFHPNYRFEGTSDDDPSNYTNRSPYPMLHILREASIETALSTYPNPEKIPERNIQVTQGLGLEGMKELLTKCYE